MKHKIKLGIILGLEFVAIIVILVLIFFAGKKTYTVRFDLNGGVLISGELEQTVTQGKSATAPTVAKDGCYLHSWSTSFKNVTKDIVVKAVWEWETSTGFEYAATENTDYAEIVGAYKYLYGDVYVAAYHDEKVILGIQDAKPVTDADGNVVKDDNGTEVRVGAFYDHDGITNIYMLDGMLYIGGYAFAECDNLLTVELPGTLKVLGEGAFRNCSSLERVELPEGLESIPKYAFEGCSSLKEIVIPASVKSIGYGAFKDCDSLEKITFLTEDVKVIDEETEEEKTVETKGLLSLADEVFSGCSALTEIKLPETVKTISKNTFAGTTELTVYLTFVENEAPEGFFDGWDSDVTVVWEYVEPETESEENDAHNRG